MIMGMVGRRRLLGVRIVTAMAAAPLLLVGSTAGASARAPVASVWPVYHGDPEGHGVAAPVRLAHARRVWTSPALDGQLYGEPLVVGATVVVATEDDSVYALNARTGAVRWMTHLGTPVSSSALPCGDIVPTVGITSTPVIDLARQEVFVVADEEGPAGPQHQLVGLRLSSGSILLRQDVDPPGISEAATLQRVALTLDAGRVVFGYGGNYGDCSTYHGWIVSVPEVGGPLLTYEIDRGAGEDQGAVWMGGAAPAVDAKGDIWFAAGNGSTDSATAPYDGSEAVVELSSSLELLQFFAPSDWAADNAHDLDIGSSAPALLGDGLVFQAGKSQTAYLLSQSKLGGIGGQLASLGSFCGNDVDGGDAVQGSVVYVPCMNGELAVRVSVAPPSLQVLWQAPAVVGPPIVAGGFVWAIGGGGNLDALNPGTGAVVQQFQLGAEANHFPTPSVGDGRLFAPGANQVEAFVGR
jgi:polyvinyl alcohol dehydrogenase (cytochrome)